jgi:hypothetical protein
MLGLTACAGMRANTDTAEEPVAPNTTVDTAGGPDAGGVGGRRPDLGGPAAFETVPRPGPEVATTEPPGAVGKRNDLQADTVENDIAITVPQGPDEIVIGEDVVEEATTATAGEATPCGLTVVAISPEAVGDPCATTETVMRAIGLTDQQMQAVHEEAVRLESRTAH